MLLAPMKTVGPPLCTHLDHVNTAALLYGSVPSPIMPPTKRPKLSLQTSSLPSSYGSKSTTASTKLDALSAVTPTTLNTFNNTFDLALRPSPISATVSPAFSQKPKSAFTPTRRKAPYDLNLPLGVRSILKNSALAYESRRGSLTTSASPRSTRRVFFPAPKKVTFKPIVEEDIVTHEYVARHIDLSSSEEDLSSDRSQDRGDVQPAPEESVNATQSTEETVSVSIEDHSNDVESRGRRDASQSPSSHRSKRKKRRWEWTIEGLDKGEGAALVQAQKEGAEDDMLSPKRRKSFETEEPDVALGADGSEQVPVVANGAEVGYIRSSTPVDEPPGSSWLVV